MLNSSMASSLHNYLRRFRKEAGLSQREVARLVGETRSNVARHELGLRVPGFETVLRYRVLYDRPVGNLFRGAFEILERETRSEARALFESLKPGRDGRKTGALGRIAYPNDPVIVPIWEE